MFEPWIILTFAIVGLVAGSLGGMLGVGGSVIMIPCMVIIFGQGEAEPGVAGTFAHLNQHLYQASAMIVNVFVAIPATVRHWRAGAVMPKALKVIVPAALVAIPLGVWVSNLAMFREGVGGASGPVVLGRVMAAFLIYVIAMNVRRMFVPPAPADQPLDTSHVTAARGTIVGSIMGLVAGLMGVGGGAIAVPLQQVIMKLRLRNCIANSAAVICITAGFGAAYKNATLGSHGLDWTHSIWLAVLLSPTALIGGFLGARLTHVLPIRLVRGVFIALMVVAAYKLAAL